MKAARIKQLRKLLGQLEEIQAKVEEIKDQQQNEFDEKSERWQESEAGEECESEIDTMEEIYDQIGDAINSIDEVAPME